MTPAAPWQDRVDATRWDTVRADLDAYGCALTGPLLTPAGEFLLHEQRPRAQSRATATLIPHGHGLVFTTRDRPVKSRPAGRSRRSAMACP